MTAYTAQLTITARTAWDIWYDYSDRACADTAKVYRWYVGAFFSEAAAARYQWIGEMLGCVIALAYLYTKRWVDAEVSAALVEDHIADAGNMVQADPFCPTVNPHPVPAMAAAIAPTVPTLVVPVEAANYSSMNTKQLRAACTAAGICWRNAHGKSKHLSKGEMITALS